MIEHGPHTVKGIVSDIDNVLAQEEIRSATLHDAASGWSEKLVMLRDIEGIIAIRLERGEMTFAEADEALTFFLDFLS